MMAFTTWLGATSASHFISNAVWIVPFMQIIHLLCLSVVVAANAMLNLRLLQVLHHPLSIATMARRFLPWIWGMLVVLLLTGMTLIVGEPQRELLNNTFWIKMALIAGALLLSFVLSRTLDHDEEWWSMHRGRKSMARAVAVVSMGAWIGIVVCGRWIAYTQS